MKILKFWWNLIKEIRLFYIYRKTTYSIRPELLNINFRVDWLGRVYSVINLKEELYNQADVVKQAWVLQQMKEINEVLLKSGISDISYPEISPIEGENAYLLVIWPEYEYLTIERFFLNVGFIGVVYGLYELFITYLYPILLKSTENL